MTEEDACGRGRNALRLHKYPWGIVIPAQAESGPDRYARCRERVASLRVC